MINEVSAAGWNGAKDEDGDAKDWVELYNSSTIPADISFWGLSNKADSAFRWVFPAKTTIPARGYLTVWLSKKDRTAVTSRLHTNFNLDNGADSLFLSMPDGSAKGALIDSASPKTTEADKTWGRMPSGDINAPFGFLETVTKGAANTGAFATTMVDKPTISPAGGVFASGQTVTISGPAGAEIRYTVDGSDPISTSKLYTGPITVDKSQSVRARAFAAGSTKSLQATESYVVDADEAAKYAGRRVLMVTLTPAEVSALKAANKRLLASSIDLRETDGSVIFKGDAESKVAANAGSIQSQANYPFNISLRDARGAKDFTYNLFPNKGEQTLDRVRIRNSGNDWFYGRMRDALAQNLFQDSDTLWADYSPTVVFLNGAYNGLMDIREREDESLVESTTGTSNDAVQYISDGAASSGGAAAVKAWNDVQNYFATTNMSVAANYAEAQNRVDIQNIATVTAEYAWAAVWDWPWNNYQSWRSSATDNKWRLNAHDFDISMDITPALAYGAPTYSTYNMYPKLGNDQQKIFASLMKNADFKNLFINTVADQLNYQFDTGRTNAKLDEFVAMIEPYIGEFRAANPRLGTAEDWKTKDVERLRAFLNTRNDNIDKQTQTQYKLSARIPITVGVNDQSQGSITLNSMDLTGKFSAASTFTGSYYPEVPVTVTAQSKPGFEFVGWQGSVTSADKVLTVSPKDASNLTAVFQKAATVAAPVFAGVPAQKNLTGDAVDLTVAATDPAGLPLTYSAKGLPKGIDIDPVTGHLSGKITTPTTPNTRITATNGSKSTTYTVAWTIEDRPNTGLKSSVVTGAVSTSYWKNATLSGEPAATGTSGTTFNLGTAAPLYGFPVNNFSMRWETSIMPSETGDYKFRTVMAPYDGVRVWFDDQMVIDNWIPSSTAKTTEATVPLTAGKQVSVRIEYKDTSGASSLSFDWKTPSAADYSLIPASVMTRDSIPAQSAAPQATISPVVRQLWKNKNLTGDPAQATYFEQKIGMALPSGTIPEQGIPADNFGARWTTTLTPAESGEHAFKISKSSYDGARLYVGGKLVIDSWTTSATASTAEGTVNLTAGQPVELRLDYFDSSSDATVDLSMNAPSSYGYKAMPAPISNTGVAPVQPVVGPITAEYWKAKAMTGAPANTFPNVSDISMDLASGVVPLEGYPGDNFGTRWTTTITPAVTGSYVFRAQDSANDGVRISIDGTVVLNDWTSQTTDHQFAVDLTAGKPVTFVVEYFDGGYEAKLDLSVVVPGSTMFESLATPVLDGQTPAEAPAINDATSQWWKNNSFTGAAAQSDIRPIAIDQKSGVAPYTGFPTANWSARWDADLVAQTDGDYVYRVAKTANDGVRVYVDDQLVLDAWKSTSIVNDVTIPLKAGQAAKLRVEYFQSTADAKLNLTVRTPGSAVFTELPDLTFGVEAAQAPEVTGTVANWWKNKTFTGEPALTNDVAIALDEASATGPYTGFPTSNWAVRWNSDLTASQTGDYVVRVNNTASDGVRLYLDGVKVLDNWTGTATQSDVTLHLTAGEIAKLQVEFFDAAGDAKLSLSVRTPGTAEFVPFN